MEFLLGQTVNVLAFCANGPGFASSRGGFMDFRVDSAS